MFSLIVTCRGRVRDVDERRRAPSSVAPDRLAHLLGDVDELGLLLRLHVELAHGRYPTARMATAPVAELEAYRDEADRFIAALDEEYYLHFAGLEGRVRALPDLRALLGPDDARCVPAPRRVGRDRGPRRARALALRLRGLPGRPDPRDAEEIAGLEASLSAPWTERRSATGSYALRSPTSPTAGRRERLDRARVH
jgi:hypothetical protein